MREAHVWLRTKKLRTAPGRDKLPWHSTTPSPTPLRLPMSLWLPCGSPARTLVLGQSRRFVVSNASKPLLLHLAGRRVHSRPATLPRHHREHISSVSLTIYRQQSTSTPPKNNVSTSSSAGTTKVSTSDEPKPPMPRRVWKIVKEGAAHYWDGTKLLGTEIKISGRLLSKVLKGGKLTRREKRQVCVFASFVCVIY